MAESRNSETSLLDLGFSFLGAAALLVVTFASIANDESELVHDFVVVKVRWDVSEMNKTIQANNARLPTAELQPLSGQSWPGWFVKPERKDLLEALTDSPSESIYFSAQLADGDWRLILPRGAVSFQLITRSLDETKPGIQREFQFTAYGKDAGQ